MKAAAVKHRPLVSVITAARNAADQLVGCLDSVAAQQGVAYEHWIVDAASTDGTVPLLQARHDPQLHWISEPDQGVYDAMRKAVERSQGRWIYFLGADDRLRPDALRTIATHLQHDRTIYYGEVWMTGRNLRYAGRFHGWKLALKNICQQAIFYPRAVFERYAFDPRYAIQADWVLNMACWADPQFHFRYIPVLVADFNDEHGLSSVQRDQAIEQDYRALLLRYFPFWISWPLASAVVAWRLMPGRKTP